MTRSLLAGAIAFVFVGVLSGSGCKATGVGDPCVPEQEYDPSFTGFNVDEVNVESKSFQCQTRLCLVNHFQGRVQCPYGQGSNGDSPTGAGACQTPSGQPVTGRNPQGEFLDPKKGAEVKPQCTDRSANKAVYCSCRCANVDGKTDDGARYCACPDGYTCTQLVSSLGAIDTGLTGAYCVKNGTQYNAANNCSKTCDPSDSTAKCD